jgi:hypothetical protein
MGLGHRGSSSKAALNLGALQSDTDLVGPRGGRRWEAFVASPDRPGSERAVPKVAVQFSSVDRSRREREARSARDGLNNLVIETERAKGKNDTPPDWTGTSASVVADRDTPLTTDAYVQAYAVRVAPKVSGRVVRVRVRVGEGSTVRKGAFTLSWTTARSSTR